MEVQIFEIPAKATIPIRHQVLWPHKPIDFVKVPEDETAIHFGVHLDERLVSVISLFADGDSVRFRKFATVEELQGKGFGAQLLGFVLNYATKEKYARIWCDARSSAFYFYERMGFTKFSGPFCKEDIEYYKIEKKLQ